MPLTATATIDASTIIPGRTITFVLDASSADDVTVTIDADSAGKYDFDNPTISTNVATDVYEINSVVKTGIQTVVATDTLKVTITRTTADTLSLLKFTGI